MQEYDSQPRKTPGTESEVSRLNDNPARITVEDGDGDTKTYDVEHHIKSDHGWVSLYLTRDGSGIDVQVPRERVISIERGRKRHSGDGRDECPRCGAPVRDKPRSVRHCVDGHRYVEREGGTVVAEGDVVTVRGEDRSSDPGPWKVKSVANGINVELWSATEPHRCEPVEDLTVVETAEETEPPVAVQNEVSR